MNFVGSDFASSDGSLVAGSADWQVTLKTDTTYSSIVSEVEKHPDMTDPRPKWTSGALEAEKEYRARTKYYAASGEESPWSDDVTFKTAADNESGDIIATPGHLCVYNQGAAPNNDFIIPELIINWSCSLNHAVVGESGAIYYGPDVSATSGTFTLAPEWTTRLNGAKAIDVFQAYSKAFNDKGMLVLADNGKVYSVRHSGIVPGQDDLFFKRMIKLGGVTDVVLLETDDNQIYGWAANNAPFGNTFVHYVGNQQITDLTLNKIDFGLPAGESLKVVAGASGSYSPQYILWLSESGKIYFSSRAASVSMADLGLPTTQINNTNAQLLTSDNWGSLPEIEAMGTFHANDPTKEGVWFRGIDKSLYVIHGSSTKCMTNTSDKTSDGPVKVGDNARSGVIATYENRPQVWFYIDQEGFAWDAKNSKTPTKNTAAGAIFGNQGTISASFNGAGGQNFVILPA